MLVSDHCHRTGLNRGRICRQCNSGIGLLQDSRRVLLAAAVYLADHDTSHARTLSSRPRTPVDVTAEYRRCHPKAAA